MDWLHSIIVTLIVILILCTLFKTCVYCLCQCVADETENEDNVNSSPEPNSLRSNDISDQELPCYEKAIQISGQIEENCYEFNVVLEDSNDDLFSLTYSELKHSPPSYFSQNHDVMNNEESISESKI